MRNPQSTAYLIFLIMALFARDSGGSWGATAHWFRGEFEPGGPQTSPPPSQTPLFSLAG